MAFLQRKRVDLSTLFSKDKHSDFHTKEYGNPFFWIFVFLLCFPLVLFIVYPTLLLFIRAFQGDNGFAVFSDVLQRYLGCFTKISSCILEQYRKFFFFRVSLHDIRFFLSVRDFTA